MKQTPEKPEIAKADVVSTVAALVQMLADAGIQPGKIKASLTKAAKPGNLIALEACLVTLPRAYAASRRA
ncbi:hypothetical protein [Aureimonas glaciei]|uniref:Uncharacterized protein n=1 Tax=Aureimonas glaciei TaxID=1776957 RepID=A0A916XWF0_9HYPH|nr:hypothetical protein [Aureimonas glaciei]GGD16452.1 hypothetical protein GCM10011335_19030 [Aureimonas glaciei]